MHTDWSPPHRDEPRGDEDILRQHPAYEGSSTQCWYISTPAGHHASRFAYLTRPDAEAAAARITARARRLLARHDDAAVLQRLLGISPSAAERWSAGP